MKEGVREILRYQFLNKIKACPVVDRIILFGSRARGDNVARADIDLAILCPGATPQEWQQLLDIIDNADTLLKIDCLRLEQANQRLQESIAKEGVVLYAKRKATS